MKKKIIIVAAAVLFTALTIFATLRVENRVEEQRLDSVISASEKLVQDISDKKIDEVYDMSDPTYKEAVSKDDFVTAVEPLSSSRLKTKSMREVYQGYGDYMIQFELGKPDDPEPSSEPDNEPTVSAGTLTVFMSKVDGKWMFGDIFILE